MTGWARLAKLGKLIPGTLTALATAGCAMTPLQSALRAEAGGEHARAAALFGDCIERVREIDCYVGLGELERPDGALPNCARFEVLAAEVKARHATDDAFVGAHATERVSAAALHYPDVASVAEWFDRVVADCRMREADRGELRADRKRDVLAHSCVRRRAESPESIEAAATVSLVSECEDFVKGHLGDAGIDRETDQAIGEAVAHAAVVSLDERFVSACAGESMRPVCPTIDELTRRMQQRVRTLTETAPPEGQITWARLYLKRWPAGPDAEAMRLARERASLDLALAESGTRRAAALEEFLGAWPESPLRHEALDALWVEAKQTDRVDRYRQLVERYPHAPFVTEAKARIKRANP